MSVTETPIAPTQPASSPVTSSLLSPATTAISAGPASSITSQEPSPPRQSTVNEERVQTQTGTAMASSGTSMSTPASSYRHHQLDSHLPGAFVVLQGMAGDGLRNTIDSMPLLSLRGSGLGGFGGVEEDQHHPREDSSTISSVTESQSRATLSSSAELPTDSSGSRAAGSGSNQNPSSSATTPQPTRETLSSSSGDDDDTSDGFQHVRDQSLSDDEDRSVLFFDSSNSGSEGESSRGQGRERTEGGAPIPARAAVASSATGTIPVTATGTGATEGGLHLPIPPGLTYGSLLPPLLPTTTGLGHATTPASNARSLIRGTMEGPSSGLDPTSTAGEDSFIVVPDENPGSDSGAVATEEVAADTAGQIGEATRAPRATTDASTQASSSQPCSYGTSRRTRTRQERRAIQRWEAECREREGHQRDEVFLQTANPQSASGAAVSASSFSFTHSRQQWWQRDGRLAVFAALPHMSVQGIVTSVIGDLAPGGTVVGTEMISLDNRTLLPVPQEQTQGNSRRFRSMHPFRRGYSQFLKIESPMIGYVLYSLDGYAFLGPGLPSSYVEPESWLWRVTCPDGAYVRQGLELTSVHVDTIPHGAFLKVTRKTVNTMGLSRLRVEASLEGNEGIGGAQSRGEGGSRLRTVYGWISESLNPLSGQRGPIAQPVPFPLPVHYRVMLQEGAIIRSGVELSSSQIGHAPIGSILTVVGRAFSEHPMDQCIERLKLAGCGWVSVRLNLPPPADDLVVQLVGIDGSFDPDEPGIFHLESQRRVMSEYNDPNPPLETSVGEDASHQSSSSANRAFRRLSTGISSINDTDDGTSSDGRGNMDRTNSSSSSLGAERQGGNDGGGDSGVGTGAALSSIGNTAVPTLFRSGVGGGSVGMLMMGSMGKNLSSDERCLICLTEERTATMVHGETGHIACCLTCARILKARGDRCPVCRLPIDSVIQQFWA